MAFNLKQNLTRESCGEIMMIVGAALVAGILMVGGWHWQQTSRASALETALCKMVKPDLLKPNACGKE